MASPAKLKQQKTFSTLNSESSMWQSQSKFGQQKEKPLADDIDCEEWLKEIGFIQYKDTFLTNISSDGKILLRKRLQTIRVQDFPKMNITNYEHQKALIAHIAVVLKSPFNSIARRKEFLEEKQLPPVASQDSISSKNDSKSIPPEDKKDDKELDSSFKSVGSKDYDASFQPVGSFAKAEQINLAAESKDSMESKGEGKPTAKEAKDPLRREASQHLSVQEKTARRKEAEKRRRSFDSQIWQSISNLRNKQSEISAAAENLRSSVAAEVKEPAEAPSSLPPPLVIGGSSSSKNEKTSGSQSTRHRRRWSFGSPETANDEAFTSAYQRAQAYGNMALEYDMMVTSLKSLQSDILNKFRTIINCEKASIFFVNELTRELVLFADEKWFRIPAGSGVAGSCVETGETLSIKDAYADPRFNRNIDIKTGFKTRNILAKPVRRNRGGGNIVAVVEMMNKAEGADFSYEDEEILNACCENVADVLSDRFKELMNAGERFSGSATFIMARNSSALSFDGDAASVGSNSNGPAALAPAEEEDPGPGKVRFKTP